MALACSCALAILALSVCAATASSQPAPYAAAADSASSHPVPYTAGATSPSYPEPYAAATGSAHPAPYASNAASGSFHPAHHAAGATSPSYPEPYASATGSAHPAPYAASNAASGVSSPHGATATASASSCPSPHGHPLVEETVEEEEDGFGAEEERYLGDLERLLRDGAAGKTNAARMEHLGTVLQSLGFREMAAAAPSLAASPVLAAWPGPLTVFAFRDEALHASCADCWKEAVLMEHLALGYFSFADLSYKREMKFSSALMGYCFTSASTSSPSNAVTVSIDGVEVTRPDLYKDNELVVHGVDGVLELPSGSCSSSRVLSRVDMLKLMVGLLGSE